MRIGLRQVSFRTILVLTAALTFLGGCDEQTKQAFEDGVINASTSLVGAFLQAFMQLATEAASTTAMLLTGL